MNLNRIGLIVVIARDVDVDLFPARTGIVEHDQLIAHNRSQRHRWHRITRKIPVDQHLRAQWKILRVQTAPETAQRLDMHTAGDRELAADRRHTLHPAVMAGDPLHFVEVNFVVTPDISSTHPMIRDNAAHLVGHIRQVQSKIQIPLNVTRDRRGIDPQNAHGSTEIDAQAASRANLKRIRTIGRAGLGIADEESVQQVRGAVDVVSIQPARGQADVHIRVEVDGARQPERTLHIHHTHAPQWDVEFQARERVGNVQLARIEFDQCDIFFEQQTDDRTGRVTQNGNADMILCQIGDERGEWPGIAAPGRAGGTGVLFPGRKIRAEIQRAPVPCRS